MSINEFPDPTNDSPESFDGQNIEQDSSEPSEEQKREIARWISEGMGLSDVQKKIDSDFGLSMTYMDVRFLVDDLDLTLVDKEEEKPKEVVPESAEAALSEDPLAATGGVSVDVNPVTPPGAMASGTVTFSDGQNKQWTLDQFGRLGLSGGDEGYKPSDEDVMEFQKQLDTALRGKGF